MRVRSLTSITKQVFEEVRGSFESNAFVQAVLKHIERKSALGDKILKQLSAVDE